jgi:hypothetical protein
VESLLRTSLQETERVDYFDYVPSTYSTGTNSVVLTLTQRYLSAAPKVYVSGTSLAVTLVTDNLLASDEFSYSAERGSVLLLTPPPAGHHTVAVVYSAGFADQSSDIPSWLKDAAINAAIYIQHTQAISHSKKDIPNVSKVLYNILYSSVNEHIVSLYDCIPSADSVIR